MLSTGEFIVKEWGGVKYLSMERESKILPIEDIEPVKISNDEKTIKDVQIMAVPQLACYKACLRCKAKVESVDDRNGRCSSKIAECCNDLSSALDMCMYN